MGDTFLSRLRVWLTVVVAVGVIEALYGTYQVVAGQPQIFWLRKTAYLDSATGTFVNRNHLAGYFELAIPIALALALGARHASRPLRHVQHGGDAPRPGYGRSDSAVGMLLAATALMLLAMGLTQSRGGVLSCLGGLGLGALAFGARRGRLTPRRIALGAVLLGALALVWLQSPWLLARFSGELRLTPYSRPSIWRETMAMARDFPLLGVGLGNFEFLFPRYQPAGTFTYFGEAHNDYLQLLVETGVLGAGCFAWLFWRFGGVVRRRLPASRFDRALVVLGLGTGMVALLLHSFTDFNLHIPANALLFVVAFGAIVRLLDGGPGVGPQGWVPLRSRAVGVGVLVVTSCVALVIARNWWVESLVRTIFPTTSLINPLARPPDPLPVQVAGVEVALRIAGNHAELAEAVGWMAQQLAADGMRDRAYMTSAERLQQTADAWAAAARGYQRVVELRPSEAVAHVRLAAAVSGLAEVRHGLYLPAEVVRPVVALLDRAAQLEPRRRDLTHAIAEWALGHWGLLAPDERSRAAAWVRQALALEPLRGRELLRLAIMWDPALPVQLLPDNPEVRLYLALAYSDAGRADDAARVAAALDDELSRALRAPAPRFADAQLLGRVRESRDDPRGAAEAYARAGALATDDAERAEALKHAGYNWVTAGDIQRAEQALSAARRYAARDPEVLAGLSAVSEQRGDYAAAAGLVRDAVAAAPAALEYRHRLARLYERAHEYGKANEQYRRLLDAPSTDFVSRHRVEILLGLARNCRQLELGAEARRFYQQVLEHDPQNREAREFLALFGS